MGAQAVRCCLPRQRTTPAPPTSTPLGSGPGDDGVVAGRHQGTASAVGTPLLDQLGPSAQRSFPPISCPSGPAPPAAGPYTKIPSCRKNSRVFSRRTSDWDLAPLGRLVLHVLFSHRAPPLLPMPQSVSPPAFSATPAGGVRFRKATQLPPRAADPAATVPEGSAPLLLEDC